ncbi:lipoprotein insertase outer membrane protein LolB [Luteimonas sp. Y-2-2-4F]|nr:lipoprotein insertase outer membrane protein LolB [Luteimonas sp. Y-2-2-4F]
MRAARGVALLLAGALLAGCATTRPGPAPAAVALAGPALAAATARLQAREAALHAQPALAFSGRVALSKGREGGNGRIEWSQRGADYAVTLSAPVTRQSWSLTGGPSGARIDGLEGGPRQGADVGLLLHEATGLEIPVAAMAAWAAGARADGARFGEAEIAFDAEGRLAQLRQDGWTIDYLGWQPETAGGAPALPVRLDARRDDARVRLIVDDWRLGETAAQ